MPVAESSAGVAAIGGLVGAGATLAQSAVTGVYQTVGSGVVIPVALIVGLVTGLISYGVQKGRIDEWKRLHETALGNYQKDTKDEFRLVRIELKESHRQLDEKMTRMVEENRRDNRNVLDSFAELRDELRLASLKRRREFGGDDE
jgi:hypothetical protein